MALFKITSKKRLVSAPSVRWSNVYTINIGSLSAAVVEGMAVVSSEQAVHTADVRFYEMDVRSLEVGSDKTKVTSIDVGLLGSDPTIMLPLWNVARVDFLDATGRPEIKYLRLPLQEDMIVGPLLEASLVTAIENDYAAGLAGDPAYVGPNGEAHVGFVVHPAIQMRQTGWNRRTRVGFHRGWVPN